MISTSAYLQRIGLADVAAPDLDSLRQLQTAHLLHVPFENLDIHRDVQIVPDPERFFGKIVKNGRGGFCYELNGLFYELLEALGFEVRMVSVQVWAGEAFSLPFDHLALVVTLPEGEFLTDVGFGEYAFEPIRLKDSHVHDDPRGQFRVSKEAAFWQIEKFADQDWEPVHLVDPAPRKLREFAERCAYHQTSPDSPFTQKPMISQAYSCGRISLAGSTLKLTSGDQIWEIPVETASDFDQYLHKILQREDFTHFK